MNSNLKEYSLEYLKTYLSINSYAGCLVNCSYCFLAPIGLVPLRPQKIISEKELVETLLSNPLFSKGVTILSLNNRTDPFIFEDVKKSTFDILKKLNDAGIKNPVTITSKGLLTKEDVLFLNSLDALDLYIIVTYNELPKEIQPIDSKMQLETFKNVRKYSKGITLFHQFRPIIEGVNDSESIINSVIQKASEYCDATIYSGLRVTPFIQKRIRKISNHITPVISEEHKFLKDESRSLINKLIVNYSGYPIFSHTSCAVSWKCKKSDINAHWYKGKCTKNCPNYGICTKEFSYPNHKVIEEHLLNIDRNHSFDFVGNSILINGELNQEERSYLRHNLRTNVKVKNLTKSISESKMQ